MIYIFSFLNYVNSELSTNYLIKNNFSDIKIFGYAFWECPKGSEFASKFEAKSNLTNNTVNGAVCCMTLNSCFIVAR